MPVAGNIEAEGLARKLKKQIKGEVRFDTGSRALYAPMSNSLNPPIPRLPAVIATRAPGLINPRIPAALNFAAVIRSTSSIYSVLSRCRTRHIKGVFERG